MPNKVKPIPDGYRSLTPYLICKGAAEAIEFYKKALGAEELFRMAQPDGKLGHAEMQIGDSRFMLADEFPEKNIRGPQSGGSGVTFMLYVNDVDAQVKRAVEAGGKVTRPIENKFYGDRSGSIEDPFGHCWDIATHVEDVPPEEMARRAQEAAKT